MSKIKTGGLDQYGAGCFKQQQFGTAGIEWVKQNEQLYVQLSAVSVWRRFRVHSESSVLISLTAASQRRLGNASQRTSSRLHSASATTIKGTHRHLS